MTTHKVAHTPRPPIRELGEAINSLVDNAWDWNRETLRIHAGDIANEYIRAREAHDGLLEALRRIANATSTDSITEIARAAIARAEGGQP